MIFKDEIEAILFLEGKGFEAECHVWQIPKNKILTKAEVEAIVYLYFKWNWGFERI